jgi:phosphatidylglycerophosphate synthase
MPPDSHAALSRSNNGWLSAPERRLLNWLAPRLPLWTTPDQLTAFGFIGAVIALAGYLLAGRLALALWLVNVGLIVNWFGDSLDGRIARMRGVERPRYGLFLDQSIDVLAQLLFAVGLALSGYMRAEIVAMGFATFLMMGMQGLLRAEVRRVFHLASGGIGLTEIRCLFFVANALFYFLPPHPIGGGSLAITYADILGIVWIATNLALYVATMISELIALSREERRRAQSSPTTPHDR